MRLLPLPTLLLLLSLWPAVARGQLPRLPADSARMLDSLAGTSWTEDSPSGYRQAATWWVAAAPLARAGGEAALAGRYLQRAANASWNGDDRDRCFELAAQAIEQLLAAGDSGLADTTLLVLGQRYQSVQQLPAARNAWRRAESLARMIGFSRGRALALHELAFDAIENAVRDSAGSLLDTASQAYLAAADSGGAFLLWRDGARLAEDRPDTVFALRLYREALGQAQWADSVSLAIIWLRIGQLQSGDVTHRDSVVASLEHALALAPIDHDTLTRARIETGLGQALHWAGRSAAALPYLEDALRLATACEDWPNIQSTLKILAQTHFDLGHHAETRDAYAELARRAGIRSDTSAWVSALQEEATELAVSGNSPAAALERFRRALELARAGGRDSLADVTVKYVMALGHLLSLEGDAQRFLRADADSQLALGHPRAAAVSLLWLAGIGDIVDSMPATLAILAAADSLAQVSGDVSLRARIQVSEGFRYRIFGRADSAQGYFRNALMVLHGSGSSDEVKALSELAGAWRDLGEIDSAIAYGRRALGLASRRSDGFSIEVDALQTLAESYRAVNTQAALRQAIAYYDSATIRVAAKVGGSTFEPLQTIALQGFAAGDFGIAMAWLGLAPTVGKARAAREALLAVERRRGLVTRSARARLAPLPSTESSLDRLRARHGAAMLFAMAEVGVRPEGVEVRDSMLMMIVDPGGGVSGEVVVLPRDSLYRILGSFREGCCTLHADGSRSGAAGLTPAAPPRRDSRGSLAQLSRIILPSKVLARLRGAREVVIEPDVLTSLALFAAAPLGKSGVPFGIRYAIHFTLSLALLGDSRRAPVPDAALVVGDPTMPTVHRRGGGESQLPPLSGARDEVRWVGEKLGTRPLMGDEASESDVRRLLPSASIIHLATHGMAFKSLIEPRTPFIALAPDSVNDGLLTSQELLGDPSLRLRADLVVLSACQSGVGKPGDEGMNGLQRAFLLRGARNVLYSLWNVSDEATGLFMRRFYAHWLDDADRPGKSEALRRARADLRRIPRFRAPYYWAAFQLIGAD